MRTPLLLDVPKTHMSRHERITAFKERNGIWTYRSDIPREEEPWNAMLIYRARKYLAGSLKHDDPDDPLSLMAEYCGTLYESGLLAWGMSERDAIRTLCRTHRIPCNL